MQDSFSQSYAQARGKFLHAADAAGLTVESHIHPLPGRDGETLAMDVVREGPVDARNLLIVSSACHGVEGYCGSGVQVNALQDKAWRETAQAQKVAIVYIHALNPYGFSHIRRVTHENVDLNRNFQDYSQPLPVNEAYREVEPLLLPDVWPPNEANAQATAQFVAQHGMVGLQAAVTRGQHQYPDGMFFGGTSETWSNLTLRKVLQQHARQTQRLAWIDLHTGLGPSGVGERIFACADDAAALARARAWWGPKITSIYDGSSTSAFLTGLMWMSAYQECPQAEYTGLALEYGTQPMEKVMMALRGEHWLHNHPQASADLKAQIKQDLMDAFYTDTDEWRTQILAQAQDAMHQAVQGLSQA
jgi:hypothetical protein